MATMRMQGQHGLENKTQFSKIKTTQPNKKQQICFNIVRNSMIMISNSFTTGSLFDAFLDESHIKSVKKNVDRNNTIQ